MLNRSSSKSKITAVCLWLLLLVAPIVAESAPCLVCSVEQSRIHTEDCDFSQEWKGATYYFCKQGCKDEFLEDQAGWVARFDKLQENSQAAVGKPLPDFRFPLEPIGSLSNQDLKGKVLLINMWATWCGPCMTEMPELVKLQEDFKDRGLVVLGLSFDKTPEAHQDGRERLGLNFPSIFADQPEVQKFLQELGGVEAIPVSLIVDREGVLVERLNEAADYEKFRMLVEPLLDGDESAKAEMEGTGAVVPS